MGKGTLTLTIGLFVMLVLGVGFWVMPPMSASAQTQSNAPELSELDNAKRIAWGD